MVEQRLSKPLDPSSSDACGIEPQLRSSRVAQAIAWAFVGVTALVWVGVVLRMNSPWDWAILALLAPLSWAAADLTTGFVHWVLDTYGDPEMPVFGPLLIEPFRHHHVEPKAMLAFGPADLVMTSAGPALPFQIAVALWFTLGDGHPVAVGAISLWLAGTVSTNMFHRWAHDEHAPRWARMLQRAGLILSPEAHARHHAPPHTRSYCITCGWLNGPMDRLRMFQRAERVLAWVGLKPHATAHVEHPPNP
ncbi:MAG: fatty acid desaturase CarF family protein [Myxococcota bacterium]